MIDGLITIAFGAFALMASYGKIQLSKNSEKNSEYLAKYGTLLRILGIILIVVGIIMAFVP